jgi:putative mRNA 3-end processing factor
MPESVPLLALTSNGLHCPAGDFYIDPWGPVNRAVLTHAHAAAERSRADSYLTTTLGESLVRAQLGPDVAMEALDYGRTVTIGSVGVSLHPAGHILGSAQVRIEHAGEVWVVSGHYKLSGDSTCAPFEPLRCHTFVTESTYGLPIFRWRGDSEIRDAVNAWWRANVEAGRASLLFAHPVGKAQRLLTLLDASIGPIYCHEAVESRNEIYRLQGVELARSLPLNSGGDWQKALVLAPPSAHTSGWVKRFGAASTALASGWMRIRGTRRRRSLDRGFVFSDHADWPALLRVVEAAQAESIWVTGGFRGPVVRWIEEHGGKALAVAGQWEEAEP